MELGQAIKERRSVRRFQNLEVPWYFLAECLDAAIQAPSSVNAQNWRFTVIRDKGRREKLIKACDEQYWAIKAPVLIVVCSDTSKIRKFLGVRGEALYAVQNCAAAIENLLLKATELGLGCTWIGAFDEVKVKEILEIDDEARPQAIIALGYGEEFEEKIKKQPLDNFVYFEKYGERKDKARGKLTPVAEVLKKVFKH